MNRMTGADVSSRVMRAAVPRPSRPFDAGCAGACTACAAGAGAACAAGGFARGSTAAMCSATAADSAAASAPSTRAATWPPCARTQLFSCNLTACVCTCGSITLELCSTMNST